MANKISLIFFVISLFGCCFAAYNWKCVHSEKAEMDQLVAEIMTYNVDARKFPTNRAELKPYCRETMNKLSQADDYKRLCLKGQRKQFVSLFLYSTRQAFNAYCKHPNSRKTAEFLNSASCINSISKHGYSTCRRIYSDILNVIEATTDFDSKQKLPQLCCGYFKAMDCIREKTSGRRNCNSEDAEQMIDFLNGVYEDAINAMCGDYTGDNSDKCDQVKLLKTDKRNSTQDNKPSYFNTAINVFSHL